MIAEKRKLFFLFLQDHVAASRPVNGLDQLHLC